MNGHTSVQTEGFEGILYPGNGRRDKVMIVMSGSNGGLTLTKQEAEFYHRNGMPALALALFRTKQTPKELSRVPVEYVERAIDWLKAQGDARIGSLCLFGRGSGALIKRGVGCRVIYGKFYFKGGWGWRVSVKNGSSFPEKLLDLRRDQYSEDAIKACIDQANALLEA